MPRQMCLTLLAASLFAWPLQAQEPVASSPVVSVGLFKNGLVVVKREVQLPKAGTYQLKAIPDAVHGTFWIESNSSVEAAVRLRDVEVPVQQAGDGSLQEMFAGKKITVHFSNDKRPPQTGVVINPAAPMEPDPIDFDSAAAEVRARPAINRFLVLKTAKGHLYIQPTEVVAIESEDAAQDAGKVKQKKHVLVLTVAKAEQKSVVHVSYLSHGLAWAPSYRVDIGDPKKLTIEMATVLRNEMADFKDAEVTLISGYPSVEFANVSSPLQSQNTWASFFQQIAQRGSRGEEALLSQQVLSNTMPVFRAPRVDMSAIPSGEGVDLHFEAIGKRSLLKGEAMSLSLGKGKADYERIVEWSVGRKKYERNARETSPDEMWDVLHFKNPFAFPLTTAPALVVENGKFNGQRTCFWTNVGEETSLRITKSLSVRTLCLEEEDKTKPPERVAIGRHDYTRLYLKGELLVNNHRKQPVKMHILYALQGVLLSSEGAPRIIPREGSLTDLNPTRDLAWAVSLQPGEEKKLAYSYSTLVDR